MDKQTRDFIVTYRIADQINILVHTSFAIMFSLAVVICTFLNILSNIQVHTVSGIAIILGILVVGNALSLRDKVIIII